MIVGGMKRKLGFLVGVLIVVSFIVGGVRFLGGGPKEGVLQVQSTPTASVFLDNKHVGRTPVETNAASGEHTIRLVPETTTQTTASWQGSITVSREILTYVNASLAESEFATAVETMWLEKITSKQAEVAVTTNPDGATVSLDGATKGITPISIPDVTVGEHSLAIASPGFLSRTVKIKTTAGYKLNAVVKLALSGETSEVASPSPTAQPTPVKADGGTADPTKPFVTIKDTPTGFLRVRMEPTTAATEAAQVKPGEKYTVFDSEEDAKGTTWYQIKYDGTSTGWISGQYATISE